MAKHKPKRETEECYPGCPCTDQNHRDFDAGVKAGRDGLSQSDCPFDDIERAEDWLSGWSVGSTDR